METRKTLNGDNPNTMPISFWLQERGPNVNGGGLEREDILAAWQEYAASKFPA